MRLLIIPILFFFASVVIASKPIKETDCNYGLWIQDSIYYWRCSVGLGVGDNETITYKPGYTIKLPQNVVTWISGSVEIFKLTDEQYIYVKSQEYSIYNSMPEIRDTIYTPDSTSVISFITEFYSVIEPLDYSTEERQKLEKYDSTKYIRHLQNTLIEEYRYLNNLIERYDSIEEIAIDNTRESRFLIKDGYTILLFNFIPTEIEKATSLIEITTHEDDEKIKRWKSRLVKAKNSK